MVWYADYHGATLPAREQEKVKRVHTITTSSWGIPFTLLECRESLAQDVVEEWELRAISEERARELIGQGD